ncbi:MAG: hypothetical protein EOR12_32210, partial [Mesorhizobium sp.]
NCHPSNQSILLPIYPVRTSPLLPVPIRGEVPGRVMRGGADFGNRSEASIEPHPITSRLAGSGE